jgi:hypothetical protein
MIVYRPYLQYIRQTKGLIEWLLLNNFASIAMVKCLTIFSHLAVGTFSLIKGMEYIIVKTVIDPLQQLRQVLHVEWNESLRSVSSSTLLERQWTATSI